MMTVCPGLPALQDSVCPDFFPLWPRVFNCSYVCLVAAYIVYCVLFPFHDAGKWVHLCAGLVRRLSHGSGCFTTVMPFFFSRSDLRFIYLFEQWIIECYSQEKKCSCIYKWFYCVWRSTVLSIKRFLFSEHFRVSLWLKECSHDCWDQICACF